jgi:hypothetical protein
VTTKRSKRGRKRQKTRSSTRATRSARTRATARGGRAPAKKPKRTPSQTARSRQSPAALPRLAAVVTTHEVLVATATKTVREHVIDIFVATTGHSSVEGRALKDLTAKCDDAFRATVAKKVRDTWSNLDHTYGSSDIQCTDTVDTLTARISGDLV